MQGLTATPLRLPLVRPGDDLARPIADALAGVTVGPQDVLVVAQKIVSKSERRYVRLASVQPTLAARALADRLDKDAALVTLVLQESAHVIRAERQALITQHRLGYIMANAGIDQSNLDPDATDGPGALLLPEDPDASAAALRAGLGALLDVAVPVIISDSFGRPWRRGSVGVALGVSGLPAILDLRGSVDLFGRTLQITLSGFADQIASLACLLMGEGAEGIPAVLVQGLAWTAPAGTGADLLRPAEEDLFR